MKIIDVHTHGIGGYDTAALSTDDILKIAQIHGSQGVSEIVLTLYPAPIKVMRGHMEIVKRAIEIQRSNPVSNHAKIAGMHLEGPFLNRNKYGALERESFLAATEENFRELIEGFEDSVKIMTLAPEIPGAVTLISSICDKGIIVSMGHSDATYKEAEAGFHAGARGVTHLFNAMRGFHHREPGIAGFGLLNRDIYIEVIADPFHLDERTIDLIFRMKNPDRIIIVSDAVKETKTIPQSQPVTGPDQRLLGGSTTITESAERLIQKGYDKSMIMKCITENPERYLSGRR